MINLGSVLGLFWECFKVAICRNGVFFEIFGLHKIRTCDAMKDEHLLFTHARLAKSLGVDTVINV